MTPLQLALLLALSAPPAVAPIAAPDAAPAASPAAPLVIGETFTIDSRRLSERRRINVYRPPAAPADLPLPVLYMPDGGLAEDFLHVAGLVEVLAGNGTMRPFLLVGVENTERRRDLTGPTESAADRKIAPRVGGSAAFRRFLVDELRPEIGRRYRTTAESAIVGESLAGLFVVETLLLEPEAFDTYLAFDPSLWWSDGRLLQEAGERLRALPDRPRTLYLSNGDEPEIGRLTRRLTELLAREAPKALRWRHAPLPLEHHQTIFHPAALQGFRAVLGPLPPAASGTAPPAP